MDVLYELVELLPTSYRVPFPPKLKELYQLLRKKRYTEEELRAEFCPQSKHFFNKLKWQLGRYLAPGAIALAHPALKVSGLIESKPAIRASVPAG